MKVKSVSNPSTTPLFWYFSIRAGFVYLISANGIPPNLDQPLLASAMFLSNLVSNVVPLLVHFIAPADTFPPGIGLIIGLLCAYCKALSRLESTTSFNSKLPKFAGKILIPLSSTAQLSYT